MPPECHAGPNHEPARDRGAFGTLCNRCFAKVIIVVKRPVTCWDWLAVAVHVVNS